MLGLMTKLLLWHLLLVAVVVFYPWNIDFHPRAFEVTLQQLEGGLAQNDLLEAVEFLHKGLFMGPESMDVHEGVIYTGVYGGYILRIGGTGVHKLTRFGGECAGLWDQERCGRVLGLRINHDGSRLVVADSYYGIHMVDTESGDSDLIVPRGTNVEGRKLQLINDLDVDRNGVIYFSESSTKYPLYKIVWAILEHDTSGRILKFDPKTMKTSVLYDGLAIANGVQLTHDGKALLFAESMGYRILKHHLSGDKKGSTEVFAQNLPGEPDNIRKSSSGGYWVAFVNGRSQRTLGDLLTKYPLVRLGVVRILHAVGEGVRLLATFMDSNQLMELSAYFSNGWILYDNIPKYGLVVELDATGAVKRSLHAPSGKINFISEVLEHEGHLYLGSFKNEFIGRVKLD